jgi:eukaryotic-like serine/threonine-protein kinase
MDSPKKIGKYLVEGILGRGGMGIVYKCYDSAIDRRVAVKAITKSNHDSEDLKYAIERFRHEAKAVGRLMHPNIVQIYDYAEDEELAYIVMELVKGRTLLEHIKAGVTYQLGESGEILRQILEGMGHAHAQGVVHRDIKPSNVLINEVGAIKIADFGIARTESSSLTQVGDVLGTLYYMSPEQLLGSDVTTVTDVYAIGVIAYELFTGQRPFTGNSAQVMQKVLNELPENPSMLNLKLSPAVDRVLQRALAKKPQDRFQTAEEFALQLRYAIDGSTNVGAGMGGAPAGEPGLPDPVTPDTGLEPSSGISSPGHGDSGRNVSGVAVLDAVRLLNTGAAPTGNALDSGGGVVAPAVSALVSNSGSSISIDKSVRKARVLFIDDEERILSALKALFRDRYHVFTTTDCQKALDFVSKYDMHVIVSDQRMPEMQGVEFLRRSREISPNSVRMLLTGYSDLAAIVGSMNDGEVYRFVSKPWDNTELRTVMGEAVTIGLELASAKAGEASVPERMDAGVMVIDQNEDMSRVVTELVGNTCPVSFVDSVDAAIDLMQRQEIALVVTDVDFAQEQLTMMLKLLKQENPQILSIVVTSASDSEMVIELINEAQVFRFLNKPVNVALMRTHIQAALKRYVSFKKSPVLAGTQKVEVVSEIRESTFGQSVVKRMSGARQRWRARAAAAARRRAAS